MLVVTNPAPYLLYLLVRISVEDGDQLGLTFELYHLIIIYIGKVK